ncbi:MAG: PilZ domain-containing protein [bacterium]
MSMDLILKLGFSTAICIPILIITWVLMIYIKKQMFGIDDTKNELIRPDAIGIERRQHERIDVSWPVTMETSKGTISTKTVNVSISGAFVICQNPLPLKEVFAINMNIPHSKDISITAEVVWTNSNIAEDVIVNRGMGIRFINISKEDHRALNNVLQTISSNQNETAGIDEIPMVERRQHERFDIEWPVTMETSQGIIEAKTKDISMSGAFIICEQPLPLNENFNLTFNVPNRDPITTTAEVVWSNISVPDEKIITRGMGIRFIQVAEDTKVRITGALKEYTKTDSQSDSS